MLPQVRSVLPTLLLTAVALVAAQQLQRPETIREQLKGRDSIHIVAAGDSFFQGRLQDVSRRSSAVIRGTVTGESVHLTKDETAIVTDFEIRTNSVIKPSPRVNASQEVLMVRRAGGRLLVDGKPVWYESVNDHPLRRGKEFVFFLYADDHGTLWASTIVPVSSEKVQCIPGGYQPFPDWCGKSLREFSSAVKSAEV